MILFWPIWMEAKKGRYNLLLLSLLFQTITSISECPHHFTAAWIILLRIYQSHWSLALFNLILESWRTHQVLSSLHPICCPIIPLSMYFKVQKQKQNWCLCECLDCWIKWYWVAAKISFSDSVTKLGSAYKRCMLT